MNEETVNKKKCMKNHTLACSPNCVSTYNWCAYVHVSLFGFVVIITVVIVHIFSLFFSFCFDLLFMCLCCTHARIQNRLGIKWVIFVFFGSVCVCVGCLCCNSFSFFLFVFAQIFASCLPET